MRVSKRSVLLSFLFAQLALCGLAQSRIIATYVGSPLPVNGAPAISYAIDNPSGVAADSAANVYISSKKQNRVYKVAADGSIRLVAGIGSIGYSGGLATAAQLFR